MATISNLLGALSSSWLQGAIWSCALAGAMPAWLVSAHHAASGTRVPWEVPGRDTGLIALHFQV